MTDMVVSSYSADSQEDKDGENDDDNVVMC